MKKDMLRTVVKYFCDLDKARNSLLRGSEKLVHAEQESSQHDNSLFEHAVQKLITYRLESGYKYVDGILQSRYANANL